MDITKSLNSAYDRLSNYNLNDSIVFFLGEGFKIEDSDKISFDKLFDLSDCNNDFVFPDIYIRHTDAKDVVYISGKFPVFPPGNLYTYLLFETVKSLGINTAVLQSGCSFISQGNESPDLFIAEDYLINENNLNAYFKGLGEIIELPDYLSPYECLSRELIDLAELTAINSRVKYLTGNVYYKSSKIIESPFEVKFLSNSGLNAITFSPLSYFYFSALNNLKILKLFLVLNDCSGDYYFRFQPEDVLKKKNDFMKTFVEYTYTLTDTLFERRC